jgi:hypothetical protein
MSQFQTMFVEDLPDKSITFWYDDLNKGYICKGMNSGQPSTGEQQMDQMREVFI